MFRVAFRLKALAALSSLVISLTACVPSPRSVQQGTVEFERCRRAELDPSVTLDQRRECWTAWSRFYTLGQPIERTSYAQERRIALAHGDTLFALEDTFDETSFVDENGMESAEITPNEEQIGAQPARDEPTELESQAATSHPDYMAGALPSHANLERTPSEANALDLEVDIDEAEAPEGLRVAEPEHSSTRSNPFPFHREEGAPAGRHTRVRPIPPDPGSELPDSGNRACSDICNTQWTQCRTRCASFGSACDNTCRARHSLCSRSCE